MINLCEKYCIYFEVGIYLVVFLLEVTIFYVLSGDASSERHPPFNIDRLPHNLRDAFAKLKGFQTEQPLHIEAKV